VTAPDFRTRSSYGGGTRRWQRLFLIPVSNVPIAGTEAISTNSGATPSKTTNSATSSGRWSGWRHNVNTAELYVVDGQQRLTTLMLLLAASAISFARSARASSHGVHRYIEKPDRENNVKFTLQPEVRSPYLDNAILSRDPDATASPPVATTRRSRRRIAILVLASR